MPSWFSKVFKESVPLDAPRPPVSPEEMGAEVNEFVSAPPEPRRVVHAPVLLEPEAASAWSPEVRIKAKFDAAEDEYTFLVDRPVLEGLSFWAPDADTAYTHSPLAGALFDLGGVRRVLIHEFTVKVTMNGTDRRPWEQVAKELGDQLRAHLKSGMPVVHQDFLDQIPPEEEIRALLQEHIDRELNPGIASHSGEIILNRVQGNTAYITMGGGCQGCAASSITLRSGVDQVFREAVPTLGALLDETDHASGANPYFRQLPAGMGS